MTATRTSITYSSSMISSKPLPISGSSMSSSKPLPISGTERISSTVQAFAVSEDELAWLLLEEELEDRSEELEDPKELEDPEW